MNAHLLFVVAVLSCAAVFALLEIEIEGGEGWAAGLPTWRIDNRFTRLLMNNRPLTGYHLYVHLFFVMVLHLPFVIGIAAFSLAGELRILAFLVLFWVAEDFLWFVLNPRFGIRRFSPRHIWWHEPSWWVFMPREYWLFVPIGVAMYVGSLII